MLQEPQKERQEYKDDSYIYQQPLPEPVSEEQEIHADHNNYEREHEDCDAHRARY